MIQAGTKKAIIWALLAMAPHMLIVLYWHSVNQGLPVSDAANYLHTARNIYVEYTKDGILGFLEGFYFLRGWRPIIFPALTSIFLVLSGGNNLFMVAITHALLGILFCLWTYGLLRPYLDRPAAVVGTWVVTLVPIYLGYSFSFLSEIALVTFALGTAYHLIQSQYFTRRGHSYAFALVFALMLCTRPVESVMNFVLPLLVYVVYGLKTKKLPLKESGFAIAIILGSATYLASKISNDYALRSWLPNLLALITLLVTVMGLRRHRTSLLIRTTTLWCLLTVLWWCKFMPELYNWAYSTSFGWHAATMVGEGKRHWLDVLPFYTEQLYTALMFYPIAALLLIEILRIGFNRDLRQRYLGSVRARPEIWFFCASVIVVLIISVVSPASSARRGMVAFPILMIGILTIILRRDVRFLKSRLALLCALLVVQLSIVAAKLLDLEGGWKTGTYRGYTLTILRMDKPYLRNTEQTVYDWVYERVTPGRHISAPLPIREEWTSYDVFTLTVLAIGNEKGLAFNVPVVEHEDPRDFFRNLPKTQPIIEYVMLEIYDKPVEEEAENFILQMFKDMHNAYLAGNIHEYGLKEVDVLVMSPRSKIVLFAFTAER